MSQQKIRVFYCDVCGRLQNECRCGQPDIRPAWIYKEEEIKHRSDEDTDNEEPFFNR